MRTPDGGIAPDLELAFLDMSGTVFHDNGIMERAFERTVTGLGVDPGSERFRRMLHHVRDTLGQSKAGVLEQLFASDPQRARQAVRDFERHLDELLATEGVIPVEGAEQAVTALREAGLRICLATGYNRHSLNTLLEQLGWTGLADLSLCPRTRGADGPGRTWCSPPCWRSTSATSAGSWWWGTPRRTCRPVCGPAPPRSSASARARTTPRPCVRPGPTWWSTQSGTSPASSRRR